jgi:carboxyl-terminal processing protease
VHEVREGSASEESGLLVGDQILAIDGNDVSSATFQEVRDALRGPVGTFARLTVKRGEAIVDLSVERLPMSKKKE